MWCAGGEGVPDLGEDLDRVGEFVGQFGRQGVAVGVDRAVEAEAVQVVGEAVDPVQVLLVNGQGGRLR